MDLLIEYISLHPASLLLNSFLLAALSSVVLLWPTMWVTSRPLRVTAGVSLLCLAAVLLLSAPAYLLPDKTYYHYRGVITVDYVTYQALDNALNLYRGEILGADASEIVMDFCRLYQSAPISGLELIETTTSEIGWKDNTPGLIEAIPCAFPALLFYGLVNLIYKPE